MWKGFKRRGGCLHIFVVELVQIISEIFFLTDQSIAKVYYYENYTKKLKIKYFSKKHNQDYYYNPITEKTLWTIPSGGYVTSVS